MSELKQIQDAVASLLPEIRDSRGDYLPSTEESLPIAIELFLIAFAMKPSYRPSALKIAGDFCRIVGQNPDDVESFTLSLIRDRAGTYDE